MSKLLPLQQFLLITIFVMVTFTNFCLANKQNKIPLRSTFGEPCNKTHRCKSQSWFACDATENVCRCAKPDEMVYDIMREQCVALIGEKCLYNFEQDEDEDNYHSKRSWTESIACAMGGECDPIDNLCKCSKEYYADPEGSVCYRLKTHGSICAKSYECNGNLQCINRTCSCNSEIEFYTRVRGQYSSTCVRKVGQQCSENLNHYSINVPEPEAYYCVENAVCDRGVCRCMGAYSQTSSNVCGSSYGHTCSLSLPCGDSFRCSGGTCTCQNPDFEFYDDSSRICRGMIGSNCDVNSSSSCAIGLRCVYDREEDDNFCQCNEGYLPLDRKICMPGFGQPCQYNPYANIGCDSIAGLVCKDEKCQCKNDVDIYEQEQRKCLVPVGLPCGNNLECVQNAVCLNKSKANDMPGRCKCVKGFEKTSNRTCIAKVSAAMVPVLQTDTPKIYDSPAPGFGGDQNALAQASDEDSN